MLLATSLPDPTNPATNWDAPCPAEGWPTIISCSRAASVFYPEHVGTLSVKCAFAGQEFYETERNRFAVDDSAYLILNEGQRYTSSIPSETEVESFCIFFRAGMAAEVARGLLSRPETLLDSPFMAEGQRIEFFTQLYPHDDLVTPLLFCLRAALLQKTATEGFFEEQLHILLERMFLRHRRVYEEIAMLPPVRWATKLEIYARLHRARDFMDASLGEAITLPEIARIACLSPHHFLRSFKEAFRETPHRYLTRKRLARAQSLLIHTDQPISEICFAVGFNSHGSFTTLFQHHMGTSPEKYRTSHRYPRFH